MKRKLKTFDTLYSRAWVRDKATKNIYTQDAMLVAVLAHTHGNDRAGMNGKIVRELMDDINLED